MQWAYWSAKNWGSIITGVIPANINLSMKSYTDYLNAINRSIFNLISTKFTNYKS